MAIKPSLFLSNYASYSFKVFSLSSGFTFLAKEQKVKLGFSIHDFAKNFSRLDVSLSPILVFSLSKDLSYLPLVIFLDLKTLNKSDITLNIGGEFNISSSFKLRLGSSTRKFSQNTKKDLFSSVLGASGIGFGYKIDNTLINYGIYMFGTGSVSQGLEISLRI